MNWYNLDWSDWLSLPKYWNLFTKRNWTLQDLYDRTGLSPKLQALLAGQSGDYGLPPDQIALITHTCLVWDYSEGAYYPQHHFKHLVDTIVSVITEGGGVVEFSTPVQHIEVQSDATPRYPKVYPLGRRKTQDKGDSVRRMYAHQENHQVQSVTAGGETYQADNAYISDLDPKLTVKLMHDSLALSKNEKCSRSNSRYRQVYSDEGLWYAYHQRVLSGTARRQYLW